MTWNFALVLLSDGIAWWAAALATSSSPGRRIDRHNTTWRRPPHRRFVLAFRAWGTSTLSRECA